MSDKIVTLEEAEAMVADLEDGVMSAMEDGNDSRLEAFVRLRLEWTVIRDRIKNGEEITDHPKLDDKLLN